MFTRSERIGESVRVEAAARRASSDGAAQPAIKGLHHAAFRCRDSEETRRFYEEFLGLPLVEAFEIRQTRTGRSTSVLHSFFEMGDGSCMAFFEAPGRPFEFKDQHDFDLHIALEVEPAELEAKFEAGKALGIETRGIADHGFIRSIYFRDPNGYVVELSARQANEESSAGAGDRIRAAPRCTRRVARIQTVPPAGRRPRRRPAGRVRPMNRSEPREMQA